MITCNTFNFYIPEKFCLKCQGCCKFSNINRWVFNLTNEEKKYQNKPYLKKQTDIYTCSYFKNNSCSKYDKRPFDCRLYPLLLNKKIEFTSKLIITKYQLILDIDNCEYTILNKKSSINQANGVADNLEIYELKRNKHLFSNYNNINNILIKNLFYEYKTRNNRLF